MLRLGIGPKLAAGIMLVPMLKAGVGGGGGGGLEMVLRKTVWRVIKGPE